MDTRINAGYEIVESVRLDDSHEYVIGVHPTAPARYVCWECINGDNYHTGKYCFSYRQALHAMAERILHHYHSIANDFPGKEA